jgi:antitoxin component YwqK of YwqJK toxin-antitoxin module
MNTSMQANCETYLDSLDNSALFEIAVRTHYPDLLALCLVKPVFNSIIRSPYFEECWKKHNIGIITKVLHNFYTETAEVDRLDRYHGLCTTYDYHRIKTEDMYYLNGKRNGPQITWRCTGQKQDQTMWVNGEKNGLITVWRKDGRLKYVAWYKDNLLTGSWTTYKRDGSIRVDVYRSNQRNGQRVRFYPNGAIRSECTYQKDRKNGSFKQWDRDGKLTYDAVYVNNYPTHVFHGEYTGN